MSRSPPDPPWGGGPAAAPSPPQDPLDICLALTRHLFDLAVRGSLGSLGALLGALGLRGRGGALGAWLLGLGAFAALGAALRALLRELLLPLAALYALLQALVLLCSLRGPAPARGDPDGRDPGPDGRDPGPGDPDGRDPGPDGRDPDGRDPDGRDPGPGPGEGATESRERRGEPREGPEREGK